MVINRFSAVMWVTAACLDNLWRFLIGQMIFAGKCCIAGRINKCDFLWVPTILAIYGIPNRRTKLKILHRDTYSSLPRVKNIKKNPIVLRQKYFQTVVSG